MILLFIYFWLHWVFIALCSISLVAVSRSYSCSVGAPHCGGFSCGAWALGLQASELQLVGTPFQCSCLEDPRDGGAWWAAIYGVPQSQTRLKRLRSSSNSLLYGLTLTSIHDYWKNHSFDYTDFCWQSDGSAGLLLLLLLLSRFSRVRLCVTP